MDHPSARLPHHRRHHHLAASTTNSSSSASASLVAASASTLASSAASAFLPPSFQLPSAAQTPASTPHHSPQHAPLQSLPPPQLLSHHSFDSIPRAPEGPAVPVPIAHHHPRPLQPPPPRTGGPGASGTHHQGHYTMGPRADCDKCRAGVRGHWSVPGSSDRSAGFRLDRVPVSFLAGATGLAEAELLLLYQIMPLSLLPSLPFPCTGPHHILLHSHPSS